MSSATATPQHNPVGELLLTAATWGTSFLFIKLAVSAGLTPFALATSRAGLAGLLIAVWLYLVRGNVRLPSFRLAAVLGLLNGLIPNALLAYALTRIDSAPAALLQATTPLMVAVGAHFALSGERLRVQQTIGIALGLTGLFVMIGPAAILGGHATGMGSFAVLAAAASYAAASLAVRKARPIDPAGAAFGQQVAAAVMAASIGLFIEPLSAWSQPSFVWFALGGLALISTAIPVILYFNLLARIAASRAAVVHYLVPLAAVVYGVTLLGEALKLDSLIGGTLVLTAVWITNGAPMPRLSLSRAKPL